MAKVPLSELEYRRLTDALLARIEQQVDRWLDDDVVDIDSHRTGGLLELVFSDRSKVVINTQPPLQEMWLASRQGGFHFLWDGQTWRDTKSNEDFECALAQQLSHHAGQRLSLE